MAQYASTKVADFMNDLLSESKERYEMVVQVRKLHFDTDAKLIEKIMYGGLVFFQGKELMSGIFLRKEHISIEFGNGSVLSDPDSVLEGKGKFRRHVKIRTLDDIAAKAVDRFVSETLAR